MPYNPTARKKSFQARFRISENRKVWAKVSWGVVAFMKYNNQHEYADSIDIDTDEKYIDEPGPTVRIVITKNRMGRPMTLDLTALTEEELRAIRKVFVAAFDEALPSVQLRDQEARNAQAEGDDSIVRLYRPVPEYVDREGKSREHKPGLWD